MLRSAPRSWRNCIATPCSASPARTSTGRSRSLSTSTTSSRSARATPSIVSATLAMAIARWRSICGRSATSRMRSAAGRNWRARSSCTDDCRALKPSKPSLAARRTTVAAPAPAWEARSATVPKATRCGRSSTASATRRSAAVSCGPAAAMRSVTSRSAIGRRVRHMRSPATQAARLDAPRLAPRSLASVDTRRPARLAPRSRV